MSVDVRLAVPAVAAWAAAGVAIGVPAVPLPVVLAAWAISVALVVTGRRALVVAGVSGAAVALVLSVVAVRAGERHPQIMSEAATSSRHVELEVSTTSTIVPGGEFFAATAESITVGDRSRTISVPVLVFASAADRVGIGTTVLVAGTMKPADRGDDVAFLVFADAPTVIRPPPLYLDWGNGLRSEFADAAATLPGDGAALLPGLAIGDTSAVSDDLDADMKASSLSHLTAVSGANCAVVVGLAILAGAAAGLRRALRIGIAMVVLLAFVVLVTPEPSVLRAGVMAVLVLVASLTGRPSRGVPLLAAAVLVLLAIDPWLSRNYGFVLSVLATAALLTLAGPLARWLGRWLPIPVATVIAVPLAAQLACQPVILLLNSNIPAYGVVANVLAEPAAPLATVLGLAACAVMPVSEQLGTAMAWVAWVPAAWIGGVARLFAGLPGSSIPWLGGLAGVGLLVVLTAAGVVAALTRARRVRAVAASIGLLLVVGSGSAALGSQITEQLSRPQDWQIAACDIGQGDAVLVRSADVVALIDTGPDPGPLAACLDTLRIDDIDLLVLSHYDLDHVGGTDAVVGRVATALVGPTGGPQDERLLDDLEAGGATVTRASRGMTGELGDLRWTVLWPNEKLSGIEPGNDASVTMRFEPAEPCTCLTSLFTGDLGALAQSLVLAAGPIPAVDVVKVSHHGSADQDPRLYDLADAAVGIISVGADNDYGHPTRELLEMLDDTVPVRTDRHGLVLVSASDDGVSVWTQR